MPRTRYTRRGNEREGDQKDGGGNVGQVAMAQVFRDQLDRNQCDGRVTEASELIAAPAHAARDSASAATQRATVRIKAR